MRHPKLKSKNETQRFEFIIFEVIKTVPILNEPFVEGNSIKVYRGDACLNCGNNIIVEHIDCHGELRCECLYCITADILGE